MCYNVSVVRLWLYSLYIWCAIHNIYHGILDIKRVYIKKPTEYCFYLIFSEIYSVSILNEE